VDAVSSENPSGADNQQETSRPTELDPMWVVGFVDGEGCFSVSVHRNPLVRRTRGWQLQAAFQVYQHEKDRVVLDSLVGFFGCGNVRPKGPKSSVQTYSVWAMRELEGKIIPFFEQHPLVVKRRDFSSFASIVRSMRRKEHLAAEGFERLVRLAFTMNQQGKQRASTLADVLDGSSETARQAPPNEVQLAVKVQSDPHGDMRSQAEMTWPLSVTADSSNKSA
jgi:hypothetical protein